MGKSKYMKEIKDFFKKTPVVSSADIKVCTGKKGYSYLLISNLIKRGEIKRIKKGFYTVHEDPAVSVFCFRPSYIGMQEALSIHDLWEQETNVVILTTQKTKHSKIEVFENNVILHRIKPKYMFGFDVVKYGNFYLPVSDLEKTFIDLIYFNEIPDKEILRALKKRMDKKKLENYLQKYPEKMKKKILRTLINP